MSKVEIKTILTADTKYSADSVEWCPQPEFSSYFVCGTYQLEDSHVDSTVLSCRRKGRIYLYEFDVILKSLKEHQCIETSSAILDMKWLQQCPNLPTLAVANAKGQIEVFELKNNALQSRNHVLLNPECDNLLTLSLDWNWTQSTHASGSNRRILASDSKGHVSLIEYDLCGGLQKIHSWPAHNFEAWTCAFDKWQRNIVYTGGDDTFMHAYDLRTYERILTNNSHTAGVTSFLSHPKKENILLTGSYDEYLRVFDTRSLKRPLGDINLKGGIWRLKPDHSTNGNLILVACMYENFSVVKLADNNDVISLLGVYTEHDSICYGADWCPNTYSESRELYMATCSFYDHKLCISSVVENLTQ